MDTRDEPMECEGTSELFSSLLGNVSSEQWESFKEQQSELGMYLVDDMSDELSEFSESGDEECVTKVRKKMSHLPKELEGLMGAANINFAKGNVKDAIKMCMELIRSAPTAQEPFQLLEVIYEEMGESRKSLQKVRRKMSHLPKELECLMGAANLNFAKGNVQDAIKMCMELIRSAPTAQEPFELLRMIYEEMGESRKSLQVHHGNNDFVNAIRVLESAKP